MPTGNVTTADQLLAYDAPGRHELVRGELISMSAAGWWHGAIVAVVAERLGAHIRQHDLGLALGAETGFWLERGPDTVRAPDFAFVSKARIPPPGRGFFEGPPDLCVEVTSPSDTFSAVHQKALSWLDHGTAEVWVVALEARTVSIYRSRDAICVRGADDSITSELLPGLELRVGGLFPFD